MARTERENEAIQCMMTAHVKSLVSSDDSREFSTWSVGD